MAQSAGKKLIRIDVSSDTVCPWCLVGKRNLDKAIAASQDTYDFEVRWHPYFLNPSAPKEGINKLQFYKEKFGSRVDGVVARMTDVFRGLGLNYNLDGLTGNTLDSHRLIYFAGKQGLDKQHNLVEELFLGYFTKAKYIGDSFVLIGESLLKDQTILEKIGEYLPVPHKTIIHLAICIGVWKLHSDPENQKLTSVTCGVECIIEFLLECAQKVGVEGAAEFLADPNNGLQEVNEELDKYSSQINGVPYYVLNGKLKLSGGQPPETFRRAFEAAANP